jgi:hypothetical protein
LKINERFLVEGAKKDDHQNYGSKNSPMERVPAGQLVFNCFPIKDKGTTKTEQSHNNRIIAVQGWRFYIQFPVTQVADIYACRLT